MIQDLPLICVIIMSLNDPTILEQLLERLHALSQLIICILAMKGAYSFLSQFLSRRMVACSHIALMHYSRAI